MVKYRKCSDLKRSVGFFIDIFLVFIYSLIFVGISFGIFINTSSYKNHNEVVVSLKTDSKLFADNTNLDIYLEHSDFTIKERSNKLDEAIKSFYLSSTFFETPNLNEYNQRKKEATFENQNLFVLEENEYVYSNLEISDNEYYSFFKKEYNDFALPQFASNQKYIDAAKAISNTNLVIVVVSVLVSLFIEFYLIPLFSKRNRSTLGMKVFKIGLISNSGYALTFKEFTFRFLFLYFVELILGFLSFFIITFVSFCFMIYGNKHEPIHDLIINSGAIDISYTPIYLNEYDYELKNKEEDEEKSINPYEKVD